MNSVSLKRPVCCGFQETEDIMPSVTKSCDGWTAPNKSLRCHVTSLSWAGSVGEDASRSAFGHLLANSFPLSTLTTQHVSVVLRHLCSQLHSNMRKSCNACVIIIITQSLHKQSLVHWVPFFPLFPLPPKCLLAAEANSIFQQLRKAVVGQQRTCWPATCWCQNWSPPRLNEKGYLGEITESTDINKHASVTH